MPGLWRPREEAPSFNKLACRYPKSKSLFRLFYERGDIPVIISYDERGKKILLWKINADQINYSRLLPIFFDGLVEKNYPYNFIVLEGNF